MKKRQYFLGIILASILGGAVAIGGYQFLRDEPNVQIIHSEPAAIKLSKNAVVSDELNFVDAAKLVTPGVAT